MSDEDWPLWILAVVDWVTSHPWLTFSIFVASSGVVAGVVFR